MASLLILKCDDPMRWYADKVGEKVPYLGTDGYEFKSREDVGYLNFVQFGDAEVVEDE